MDYGDEDGISFYVERIISQKYGDSEKASVLVTRAGVEKSTKNYSYFTVKIRAGILMYYGFKIQLKQPPADPKAKQSTTDIDFAHVVAIPGLNMKTGGLFRETRKRIMPDFELAGNLTEDMTS